MDDITLQGYRTYDIACLQGVIGGACTYDNFEFMSIGEAYNLNLISNVTEGVIGMGLRSAHNNETLLMQGLLNNDAIEKEMFALYVTDP
jgi:hypothetical protein